MRSWTKQFWSAKGSSASGIWPFSMRVGQVDFAEQPTDLAGDGGVDLAREQGLFPVNAVFRRRGHHVRGNPCSLA